MRIDLRHIEREDNLILGISGGADSVCLFHVLRLLNEEGYNLHLHVLHVNHGLRKEASDDENFVKKLCLDYGVSFNSVSVPVKEYSRENGLGTEEAARILRYKALRDELERVFSGIGKIAVAHNSNDQAETILFRMMRGTGLRGMSGIRPIEGNIVRPLLYASRREIEEYIAKGGYSFVTDKSNLTDAYARNRIRNNILTYANKEICEGATEHIAELAEQVSMANEVLAEVVMQAYGRVVRVESTDACGAVTICSDQLSSVHPYIKSEIVMNAMTQVSGKRKDLTRQHVADILSLFDKQVGRFVVLPYSMKAQRVYEGVRIEQISENCDNVTGLKLEVTEITGFDPVYAMQLVKNGSGCTSTHNSAREEAIKAPQNDYTKWFDYDKIMAPIALRAARADDYIVIDESGHRKKVFDLLKDNKVEAGKRGRVPVVTAGDEVIWCIGHRMSSAYKISENTRRIAEITIMEE
ncbi:MAG: tRNA lysidine(34) synthetase TilS [Lachnospiraceae bacterium]|nr:tRNA lysidine(34) synthetase TilS [Candidatus Merdinaster equi]